MRKKRTMKNQTKAAAAKEAHESSEEISKEDEEIRRLIEERRTTPKEDKQRLKEVNTHIRMHQGQKKSEKTERDSTNARIQRYYEHPRNQICLKKSAHHQDKE